MAASFAAALEFLDGLLRECRVAIPDRHGRAGLKEALGDRSPDPLRAAGDDRETAGQIDLLGMIASLASVVLAKPRPIARGANCQG